MIWFALNEKETPVVFRHGEHSYSVLNVINEEAYLTSDVEIEEEEDEEEMPTRRSSFHRRDTLISDRTSLMKWRVLTATGQSPMSSTIKKWKKQMSPSESALNPLT